MNLTCLLLLVGMSLAQTPPETKNPVVKIETKVGSIIVEIDAKHAPITAANFLRYVDAGHYSGGRFHRTVTMGNQPSNKVRIEVIQGGVSPKFEKEDFPPIPLERTSITGIHHLNGTISMARDAPDTATSDFFICIGKQPELDFGGKRNPDGQGFAAFGRVIRGMSVVLKIQRSPAKEQALQPPIEIINITREEQ